MNVPTLLLLAIALAGCAGNRFTQESPPRVVVICPTLRVYSPSEQATARAEIKSRASPTLNVFMNDYFSLRQQVRACEEQNK
jgi:hypothetical protein